MVAEDFFISILSNYEPSIGAFVESNSCQERGKEAGWKWPLLFCCVQLSTCLLYLVRKWRRDTGAKTILETLLSPLRWPDGTPDHTRWSCYRVVRRVYWAKVIVNGDITSLASGSSQMERVSHVHGHAPVHARDMWVLSPPVIWSGEGVAALSNGGSPVVCLGKWQRFGAHPGYFTNSGKSLWDCARCGRVFAHIDVNKQGYFEYPFFNEFGKTCLPSFHTELNISFIRYHSSILRFMGLFQWLGSHHDVYIVEFPTYDVQGKMATTTLL